MGAIVVERKNFTCPSRESNQGRWIYRQTLYHVHVAVNSDVVECLPIPTSGGWDFSAPCDTIMYKKPVDKYDGVKCKKKIPRPFESLGRVKGQIH